MKDSMNWKNYILALVITTALFLTIIFVSDKITDRKIDSIKSAQDSISIDIMSSETQFSLLSSLSCKTAVPSTLQSQLGVVADEINYSLNNKIGDADELEKLKRYYFLLEIRDFILAQKVDQRCGTKTDTILYVYTDSNICADCTNQGYVLTALREKYPNVRVYSFDDSSNLSAVTALLSVYKVSKTALPAIVINGKTYTGLYTLDQIEALMPAMVKKANPTSVKTTSKTTTSTKSTQ
jgi:hypothetical protein